MSARFSGAYIETRAESRGRQKRHLRKDNAMNGNTKKLLRSAFAMDESILPERVEAVFRILEGREKSARAEVPRVYKAAAVGKLLGVTSRTVRNLEKRGVLAAVRFPGSARAIGYTEASVRALAEGTGKEGPHAAAV